MSKDGALHIYSIKDGKISQDLAITTYLECLSMQWSNTTDNYICVGAKDHCAYVFNTKDGQLYLKTSVNNKAV
jgi:hypothetical protein